MNKSNLYEKLEKELQKMFNDPDMIKVLGKDYLEQKKSRIDYEIKHSKDISHYLKF
jgi:hypothetical protein